MQYRTLGRTGWRVAEIGYGAWGIGQSGWVGAQDEESINALNRAIDLGINFIDTALAYGNGHSESLVGKVLKHRAERVYVASKIRPKNGQWPARPHISADQVFPGDWIRECTERSLRNLGREPLDLQQFHVWSDEWVGQGDWFDTISRLKHEGKISAFGISINDHARGNALKLIELGIVDTVQVIYNVFDQTPKEALFPACEHHQVGVIVRVPFDVTGRVRPDTEFPPGDFRTHYFGGERKDEVYRRVQAMSAELGISVDQLAEFALRYALVPPQVSTVIPGMRSTTNVERNCRASDQGRLTDDQVQILDKYRWQRNFYR